MRHTVLPVTLAARVQHYFGLSQAELALYLGISPALAQHLGSGRRRLTGALFALLEPLARHLPPADVPAETTAAPPPGLPPPEAAELSFRRRVCQQQMARVEKELAQLARQAEAARRWAAALPALLPTPEATAADPDRAAWLTGWLRRQAQPLPQLPPPAGTCCGPAGPRCKPK